MSWTVTIFKKSNNNYGIYNYKTKKEKKVSHNLPNEFVKRNLIIPL